MCVLFIVAIIVVKSTILISFEIILSNHILLLCDLQIDHFIISQVFASFKMFALSLADLTLSYCQYSRRDMLVIDVGLVALNTQFSFVKTLCFALEKVNVVV